MIKYYTTPQLSQGGHWKSSPFGWYRSEGAPTEKMDNDAGSMTIVEGKFLHDEWCYWVIEGEECTCHVEKIKALVRVARAADVMVCHKNNSKWKDGLIPWREIAEGVNVDDLIALAEALEALPKGILDEE